MPDPVSGAVAGTIGSSLIGGRATRKAADAQAAASREQVALQRELAKQAQDAAKFRAVGITSPYATPNFNVDDEGNLVSVDTQLSPELQQRFDALQGATGGLFSTGLDRALGMQRFGVADQLFGMGQQQLGAVNLDPTQAAAERTARLQELMAPQRAVAQENLFSNLASKGLTGLAVDQGTGQQVNPYMAALASQQAQEDRRIAAESLDLADQDIARQLQRATGLFGAASTQEADQGAQVQRALQPYQNLFGMGQDIYNIGLTEQDRAMALADTERQRRIAGATGQANFLERAGQSAMQGANAANQTRLAGQMGYANAFGNLNFGSLFNQQPQNTQYTAFNPQGDLITNRFGSGR